MYKSVKIQVIGKVQGVYFRASTQKIAENLTIFGTVQNQADGSVLIHAQGAEDQMNQFLTWLNHGPEWARVDELVISPIEQQELKNFRIIR